MAEFTRITQAAGSHNEGARANAGRMGNVFTAFLRWTKKRLPSAGAMNYALDSLGLTEFGPIGAGIGTRASLTKTQPPQLYVPINAVPTSGLGGLVAGQIMLQGLYDPQSETYQGAKIE